MKARPSSSTRPSTSLQLTNHNNHKHIFILIPHFLQIISQQICLVCAFYLKKDLNQNHEARLV